MEVAPPDRVVIADDDAPTRELLRTVLSFAPRVQIVGEAADGAEAVRLALSRRADAVVLDVNMPGLDGGRAAEVIRAYRPRVKVLFHTAEVDGALRRRAERLNAPILLKGDPEFALHALDELLAETGDHLDPIVALVVAALQRNNCDGVVVVDDSLNVQFYDTGAGDLLGEPIAMELLHGVLTDAVTTREAASARVDGGVDVRAVPLVEGGDVVGVAAYVTADA
jgi:DNA-binding NarL/FixJ family response regulator